MNGTDPHRSAPRPSSRFAVLALLALGLPAACGDADGGVASETDAEGQITLRLVDTVSAPGLTDALDQMIAEFTSRHDNVTVERTTMSHGDYQATALLDATGPNPPDVFEGNIGWSLDGPLVQAGALLPLDDLAAQYGWAEAFGEEALAAFRFSPDGREWGRGTLYGIAQRGDLVKVFYNRDVMADLGLDLPQTLDEFEEQLDLAAQAGVVPIAFGNTDQWPGNHTFAAVQNATASSPDEIRGWIFGDPEHRFDTPATLRAAERLAGWAENGYFSEGFNGLTHDDAWPVFASGEALFMITGSWMNGNFSDEMGDTVGLFPMPPEEPGRPPIVTGGLADPWHISSQTQHPELAAELVSILVGESAAGHELGVGSGITGYPLSESELPEPGLRRDSLDLFRDAGTSGRLVPYLDFATPDMGDVLFPAAQELLGGRIDAETFVERVQDASDAFDPQQ